MVQNLQMQTQPVLHSVAVDEHFNFLLAIWGQVDHFFLSVQMLPGFFPDISVLEREMPLMSLLDSYHTYNFSLPGAFSVLFLSFSFPFFSSYISD